MGVEPFLRPAATAVGDGRACWHRNGARRCACGCVGRPRAALPPPVAQHFLDRHGVRSKYGNARDYNRLHFRPKHSKNTRKTTSISFYTQLPIMLTETYEAAARTPAPRCVP